MLSLRHSFATVTIGFESVQLAKNRCANFVRCGAKGPRPRYPRVWKNKRKIGTISKSLKFVECVKELSNVKEEVYGALDSLIAWEVEFPLITVKKALKTLENEKEWKRIIQVTKWMLSKGQGRTMGSYYTLLNALAEDGRLDEAEEVWHTLFSQNMESMPKKFFDRMISIYYRREMHDKMFDIFADMEELGIRPTMAIVTMVGDVFMKLDMMDKYKRLKKKYPPPKWEYRFIKGKRIKVPVKYQEQNDAVLKHSDREEGSEDTLGEHETSDLGTDDDDDDANEEAKLYVVPEIEESPVKYQEQNDAVLKHSDREEGSEDTLGEHGETSDVGTDDDDDANEEAKLYVVPEIEESPVKYQEQKDAVLKHSDREEGSEDTLGEHETSDVGTDDDDDANEEAKLDVVPEIEESPV